MESTQPFSQTYLVELTAFASSNQDRASDELRNFAECLKPYLVYSYCVCVCVLMMIFVCCY